MVIMMMIVITYDDDYDVVDLIRKVRRHRTAPTHADIIFSSRDDQTINAEGIAAATKVALHFRNNADTAWRGILHSKWLLRSKWSALQNL